MQHLLINADPVGVETVRPDAPVLTSNGITAPPYIYVWEGGERNMVRRKRADRVLTIPDSSPYIWEDGSDLWVEAPASLENLEILACLPYVSESCMVEAWRLINQWGHVIPMVCFMSILMKNGACKRPGFDQHLLPAVSRTITTKKMRDLTGGEAMCLGMGYSKPEDFMVETSVTTHEVNEEAASFDQWCDSFPLYSQQMIAAWAIYNAKRIPLWKDMRVGKTASATAAAKRVLHEGKADHLLVVCPVINMYDPWINWLTDEGFEVHCLDGTIVEDRFSMDRVGFRPVHKRVHARPVAFVINYERLGSRHNDMIESWDMSRVFLVADETSAIKNPSSNRSLDLRRVCKDPEYVVLLNGTPTEQGPQDLWAQMRCVDSMGVVWGQSFDLFAHQWLNEYQPGKFEVCKDDVAAFQAMISQYSIRYIRAEADQFAGRDKTFRHVTLNPTLEMYEQTQRIAAGFLESVLDDGTVVQEAMTKMIIRTYGFMREVACGYDKFRLVEGGAYARKWHRIDPKLLWIECYKRANPSQPLVIYTEFNEQEHRLKQMLDRMGVLWSSSAPSMVETDVEYLANKVTVTQLNLLSIAFPGDDGLNSIFVMPGYSSVLLPDATRMDKEIVRWASYHLPEVVIKTKVWKKGRPYTPAERSEQVRRFHHGETDVYILKWSQGRGIKLSRKPAVEAGIGVYPAIISCAPPWSLGAWKQGGDRCVETTKVIDSDGNTVTKNVNTLVYSLSIMGTLEQKILDALRKKEDVASSLMKDIKREGFQSFVSDMLADMRSAMKYDGKDMFDAEEIYHRITLGIPPYSKLTYSLIRNKAKSALADEIKVKFGKVTNETTVEYIKTCDKDSKELKAWDFLQERVK